MTMHDPFGRQLRFEWLVAGDSRAHSPRRATASRHHGTNGRHATHSSNIARPTWLAMKDKNKPGGAQVPDDDGLNAAASRAVG
jgi:hypothetical protein